MPTSLATPRTWRPDPIGLGALAAIIGADEASAVPRATGPAVNGAGGAIGRSSAEVATGAVGAAGTVVGVGVGVGTGTETGTASGAGRRMGV